MKGLRYTIYIFLYGLLIFSSGLMNIVVFKELDWSLIIIFNSKYLLFIYHSLLL